LLNQEETKIELDMLIKNAKILPLVILLLTLPLLQQTRAGSAILRQVSKTTERGKMQIFLRLSSLPAYKLETLEKRVDLALTDTVAAKSFKPLAGDDKMIRMVTGKQAGNLLLSFYFRYPPQHVRVKKIIETASIMLDIQLGNPLSARYPDLSAGLHGLTLLNREEVDFTNPVYASYYGTDWKFFIRTYESPVVIRPHFRYSLPPFPLAASIEPATATAAWLGKENIILSRHQAWQQIAENLKLQLEKEVNEAFRKRQLLTYGECLVRANMYEEPYKLLQQISLTYPDTSLATYANILFVYVLARHEDPYLAAIEIKKQQKKLQKNNPLLPYINIFQAELALETDHPKRAATILARDDIAYPENADLLRLLRQADTYFGTNDTIKALIAYNNIDQKASIIGTHPRSLAQYADTLYTHQRYAKAVKTYQALVQLINGTELQPQAMFRLAMARLHKGEKWTKTVPQFSQIQNAFPGSEGDFRARLKINDLKFLHQVITAARAAEIYGQTGKVANKKQLREEALVKQAMVQALAGNHETSISLAMKVLRDFRYGSLTTETEALIVSQLPAVLKKMTKNRRYIDALVLAKQNRKFFARGWLGIDLLFDLAHAYEQLGAYDRAGRVYQYILDVATGKDQERAYVPMIRALYNSGRYDLVEDYGDQYFSRFPDSPAKAEVYLLRVKALQAAGETEAAVRLLEKPDRPSNLEIEKTAARIFFHLNRWHKVISLLEGKKLSSWTGGERDYLLAESLFQSKQYEKAIPVFRRLVEEVPYGDQAMFRLAEIYEKTGKPNKALNQFKQLAEKGKDSRWKKLAEEEIKIIQLNQDRTGSLQSLE